MDPISMLKSLFPSQNIYMSSLGTRTRSAASFGPAVILGGALRAQDSLKTAGVDPMVFAQYGVGGAGNSTQAQALKRLESQYGAMVGGDGTHAVAGYGKSVQVGDNSVIETDGGASVTAGSNSTVIASNAYRTTIFMDDQSVAVGGAYDDWVFGGENSAVRAGYGNDWIRVGDGSVVSGDGDNDTIETGHDSIIDGGTGDDTITAGSGSTIDGGTGNDIITIEGPDTGEFDYTASKIIGGQGDDTITVIRSAVDMEYRTGDGNDVITGDLGESTLRLVDSRHSDVTFTREADATGDNLRVTFTWASDSILIKGADLAANEDFTLMFRGGTERTLSDIMASIP